MGLEDFYFQFPSKKDCLRHLENLRWNGDPICPYCNSRHFTKPKLGGRYHCNTCNTSYSVTVNTIFHKTKIDLQKWFYAIYLILNYESSVSSRDLGKEINTTKDTAWRIIKEIKNALIKQEALIHKLNKYEQ